jgi:hypothetical protein
MLKIDKDKIHIFILCFLACFPMLNMKIANGTVIVLFIFSLLFGNNYYKKWNKNSLIDLSFFLLPFIYILIHCLIIDQSKEAHFYLEKSLSLGVFPIIFFLLPLNKNKFDLLFKIWTGCSILVSVWGLTNTMALLNVNVGINKFWQSYREMFNDPSFSHLLRSNFENFTKIHPTYASMFLGISFLYIFNLIIIQKISNKNSLLFYIVILVLIFGLQLIVAARTPLIATLLIAIGIYTIHNRKNKKVYLFHALAIIIVTSLVILVPSINSRFKEVNLNNTNTPNVDNQNSLNIRAGIYKCSFEIIKNNWVLGVGPGKLQTKLNECYFGISKEVYERQNYNTHNQILDYWAAMGILAPILLILFFGRIIINFHNEENNYLIIGLILFFLICMLTENILNRQNGVIPFALFMSFLGLQNKPNFTK